jgi:hypothetical protein
MNDSLFFATFDPLYINAPETCPLCFVQPPAFSYEYCIEQEDGKRNYNKGYCCITCSGTLLHRLAGREAKEWAQEEEDLAAGHLDVADLQKRRLATFGNLVR